jgi:poly(3-hydroxybutyrate) depolymerase
MLHGALQDPEDFALGAGMNALAEAHGLLVAYPAQTSGGNLMRSWNWFRPGDQQRGAGEPAIPRWPDREPAGRIRRPG